MAPISLFMIGIFLISNYCFAQEKQPTIDPLVMSALDTWAGNLKQALSALRQDKINEAVDVTCKELEQETKLPPFILQSFMVYASAMIDYPLRLKMMDYYFKAGGMLDMPHTFVYSIAFTDALCRDSWCKLHEQTLDQYEVWKKSIASYKEDISLEASH